MIVKATTHEPIFEGLPYELTPKLLRLNMLREEKNQFLSVFGCAAKTRQLVAREQCGRFLKREKRHHE